MANNKRLSPALNLTHPELAAQWHPTKNIGLSPDVVTYGSGKSVWWQCEKGHEWQTTIRSRSTHGHGCPYCTNKKLWVGFNDFATRYPELAKEWHPTKNGTLRPSDILIGTDKVWWQCKTCGGEWSALPKNRVQGHGCPYCTGQKHRAGVSDFCTRYPQLAKEWHPTKNGTLKPSDILINTNQKVWWQCSKGHSWLSYPKVRTKGKGCPYCAGKKSL